jgi:excisionase family DNA binding protein
MNEELPNILTPAQIARYMRIGRAKVYQYIRTPLNSGGIPHMMCGSHIRVRRSDFMRWLDWQVQETSKPKLKRVK